MLTTVRPRHHSRSQDSLVFSTGMTRQAASVSQMRDTMGETSDHILLADSVGTRDLATLATLTEESVIAELQKRYAQDVIYTNIGDILIAINPFKVIPGLYGEIVSLHHYHDQPLSNLPHVFRISQAAYKNLWVTSFLTRPRLSLPPPPPFRVLPIALSGSMVIFHGCLLDSGCAHICFRHHVDGIVGSFPRSRLIQHKHQCCVISGESGAGKTETAKFLVEHLLSMCKGSGKLEERIMQVNPLLEAFGNAKTVINDNSSRFGKYLDIKFGFYGEVLGATLSEYLLEKSRVVRQGDGERNFHIFYYIFAGLSEERKTELKLADSTSYHYLRGGTKGLTRDGAIDINAVVLKESYASLIQCMTDVGFDKDNRDKVFELLAAVLQLGAIDFEDSDDGYAACMADEPVQQLADMAGVSFTELKAVLTSTSTITRNERMLKNYSRPDAYGSRDAIAKAMYGRLFGWIVAQANNLLKPRGEAYVEACGREGGVTDIGILDIFGFENFQVNSFEQLCINIANEQLQFYFNQHIFAWELAAYAREGIDAGAVS